MKYICYIALVAVASLALYLFWHRGAQLYSTEVIGFYESENGFAVERWSYHDHVDRGLPDEKGCFHFAAGFAFGEFVRCYDAQLRFIDSSRGMFAVPLWLQPLHLLDTELIHITYRKGDSKPKVVRTHIRYNLRRGLSLRDLQRLADTWRCMIKHEYVPLKWIPVVCPAVGGGGFAGV